ncbi:MAG: chemotaxis protein CheR [Candidatus Atribacteria bacterium]|nr:chemotaxis protein CheR [Candidatus Atribacteria bacterium]
MAFTYFFRDLQTLEMICDYALPSLRSRRYINIWDAGCAMGPEPYTLAILLRERIGHMYFRNIKIKATDIDGSNLFDNIILEAVYPREQVERIPKDIFEKYFVTDEKEDHFRIIDEIKKSVTFQKHDLLTFASIGQDFGLILCKNVLLHFNEAQRIEVIRMFHDSLIEGGFLAMEQTQKLPKELEDLFEPVVSNAQLYRKIIK